VTFSYLIYYQKNYATQLAPSVGKTVRTKPAKFIRQTQLKMAEENVVVLINNPLPHPLSTRKVMSEVHIEANEERSQRGREVRKSEVRGGGSRTTGKMINAEILKRNRKIERLERELHELKNAQEGYDQEWSRRQRSRSHSGSCESSHRFPK
jgi:hypothetical protein